MVNWGEIALTTGKGVRVLVIDSGIEADHPEIRGYLKASWAIGGDSESGYRVAPVSPVDVFGHGTACAGLIRQHAPDAHLESLQALDGDLRTSSDRILASILWGVEEGFDVINCSFGSTKTDYLGGYKRVVDEAFRKGVILVAACNNSSYRITDYPSSFPAVISTDYGRGQGLRIWRRPNSIIEFVAPGDKVRVAWKNSTYRKNTGSSFAAPVISALVAKIREKHPDWNTVQMKSALYDLAEPWPASSPRASNSHRAADATPPRDLTDDEWRRIGELVKAAIEKAHPEVETEPRKLIDGVLWGLTTGAAWADLPARYPSGAVCRQESERWRKSGLLAPILREIGTEHPVMQHRRVRDLAVEDILEEEWGRSVG